MKALLPPELAALLDGPLRPIRELITWAGKFFDRLAIALGAEGLLFGALKLFGLAPFSPMAWSRVLEPLWLGVPITVGVAVGAAVVVGLAVAWYCD